MGCPRHPSPAIPGVKERATRQAEALPAISGFEFEKLIRSMPSKAAGLDGWSVDLLKSLDSGEVASLASMWREIEVTGETPTQMTFTAFIVLAKTETIERPIGLMSTLLKLGMKARWGLIEQWLVEYRDHLWWDCALPSRSTHDASLRRGFAYEAAHADRVHRCSLFVDLSTFYEGVDHLGLCEAASRAGFPDLLLHLALEAYRGGRIIISDEVASPTAYACKGIIAGCPLAPTLSKLAVGESIRQTCTGPDIDYVGTWIDAISVDTENKQAERAAAAVVRVFRRLHKALTADGHQVSIGKTYFVASSPAAERALKKKLGAGDPPIQSVAKDLGMELTGGRRRCTHLSSARRRKATARLGKLKGLRIKSPRTTSRIFSMSVLASGQWGHQAQGVSPKVMRSVRLQAASIAGRVNTGSIEVALEMGGPLVQDPLVSIVTQHFKGLARVLVSLRDREQLSRTWAQLTEQLRRPDRWKVVCGPLGAMVAYLYDLGIQAEADGPDGGLDVPGSARAAGALPTDAAEPHSQQAEIFANALVRAVETMQRGAVKASSLDRALDGAASGSGETSSLPAARRNSAARRALRDALVSSPSEISAVIEALMSEDLSSVSPGVAVPGQTSARAWAEHRSKVTAYPSSVWAVWIMAGALDCLRTKEQARARLNLGLMIFDQMSIDRGSFVLEVPPPLHSFRQHENHSTGQVYSRLLDPRWAEVAIGHLKEQAEFLEKRAKLGRNDPPAPRTDADPDAEPAAPKGGRRPRKPA